VPVVQPSGATRTGGQVPEELVLVRHGRTEWSESGRHTGSTDVPLDDTGRAQARDLGSRLRGQSFDLVVTSPLGRARDTCELAGFGAAATVLDDLREWDYGRYEGLTTAQIRVERPGWLVFEDGCPEGEDAGDVSGRADRVLASVRADEERRRVLVFGHGHMLRVLAARWLGLPGVDGRLLRLDPATLSHLGWEHEVAVVTSWNA
jgi:probable phosphoglycerate mutase